MINGEVIYLYAFDVASEISTTMVNDIFAGQPTLFELRTDHTLPKDIPLYKPLSIESGLLAAQEGRLQIRPVIHIYDIGVISFVMRTAFSVNDIPDLQLFHDIRLKNGQTLDKAVFDLCLKTCHNLKDAMVQQSAELPEPEAYTVFCFTDIGNLQDIESWMHENRSQIAGLLTQNQPDMLSPAQANEVLRLRRSYTRADLAIIDWDAALVVDTAGYVEDVLYVLELANLQLEEYRIMDKRLDRYLNKVYDDIQRPAFPLLGTHRILRHLRTLRVDVTKLNDEVTHITKFFGDWYLARIYMDARERFHLNQWRNSVEERLQQIDDLYSVTHAEATSRRMLWLEVLIVFLFAVDLLSLFLLKK